MADGSIVREELWFDSADGSSRVHGYVWWPAGVIGSPDGSGLEGGAAVEDDGTDAVSDARGSGASHGPDGGHHVSNAPARREGDSGVAGASGDDATGGTVESQAPVPANALEAAVRAIISSDRPHDATTASAGVDGGEHAKGRPSAGDAPSQEDAASPVDDPAGGDDDRGESTDGVEVKGVVQLVHGMAEHIGRYDEFARFLAENGYIVCGHDHIGHGLSAPPERLGCIPARRGKDYLVADVGRLRAVMQDRIGDELPYFLLGHSLGSFVVRSYVAHEGDALAGAILCGTGHVSPVKSALGHLVSRLVGLVGGQDFRSRLLHAMGLGAYASSVRHRRSAYDWLSYNAGNVDAYASDELCGFRFSAGGYATVTALTGEVCTPGWAAWVPRLLPILLIGGNADPVGANGEGVRRTAQLLREAGCADVTCMIYKHMRHEILNEDERQMVFDDVLFWLEVRS